MTRSKSFRKRGTAPHLGVDITPAAYETAIRSASGACLIRDAIKEQYPELTEITVDMVTVRATDRKRQERYTWFTPAIGRQLLLGFDQGWTSPITDHLVIDKVAQVSKIRTSHAKMATRARRKAHLEAQEAKGALTSRETRSLRDMRAHDRKYPNPLPTTEGPVTAIRTQRTGNATVVGGKPIPRPRPGKIPGMLAGIDRHFGAKLAEPGLAFQQAVDAGIAERLREMGLGGEAAAS